MKSIIFALSFLSILGLSPDAKAKCHQTSDKKGRIVWICSGRGGVIPGGGDGATNEQRSPHKTCHNVPDGQGGWVNVCD